MHKLPIEFKSAASASEDFQSSWEISSSGAQARCAIPVEFGGVGDAFSPEDLFLQALINCFVGTFKVYAKGSRISFTKLHVNGALTVDKNSTGEIRMKNCRLDISIYGGDRPDRIETIVAKVMREGFILNSVKTEIDYVLHLHEAPNDRLKWDQ